MMLPQLGVGGLTPMPKYESVASRSTVVEIPRVAQTMMVGKRCGRMCLKRIREVEAPRLRTASIKSRSEIEMVWA